MLPYSVTVANRMTIVKEEIILLSFSCVHCITKWMMKDDEIQNYGEMYCPTCGVKQRIAASI